MFSTLLRWFHLLPKMTGDVAKIAKEGSDVVQAVIRLAKDAADNGRVHKGAKISAQSELAQFVHAAGKFIDSMPEELAEEKAGSLG